MFGSCVRFGRSAYGIIWRSLSANASKASVSSDNEQQHRLMLFEKELQRQRSSKSGKTIKVSFVGADGKKASAELTSGQSTPHNVAQLVSEQAELESALALVDGVTWDLHRPLVKDCVVRLLQFKKPTNHDEVSDLKTCNSALFRSGSLMLGAVLETAFKETYRVELVSFPPPVPKSGSFVYDCRVTKPREEHSILELSDRVAWQPNAVELRVLSYAAQQLISAKLDILPLDVPGEVAMEMYKRNAIKSAAVHQIRKASEKDTVTMYRIGNFVDISAGPMIANSALIGRLLVAAVHQLESKELGLLMRVQGLAVPRAFLSDFHSTDALLQRASVLNFAFLPPGCQPAVQSAAAATA